MKPSIKQAAFYSHRCSFTVSVQRDDIGSVQNLHRQSLLRSVVVTLHTDPAKTGVFECFLQHSTQVLITDHVHTKKIFQKKTVFLIIEISKL